MKNPAHHIIFEGAELVGKSYIMSRIYDFLEEKYNKNRNILDGCHWFNSDIRNKVRKTVQRILQNPRWYIMQQREYQKEIQKTMLPYKKIDLTHIPNPQAEKTLLQWFQ